MMTYLIKGLSRKGMAVFTYTDAAAATRAAETRFKDYPTTVASESLDLSTKSGPALVAIYNGLIEEGATPVNKFTTKQHGIERVFAMLEAKYQHQPVESESDSVAPADAPTETNEEDMTTKGKKKAKTKAAKAPKAKKAKAPRVPKDRNYKAEVVSKGSEARKAEALGLIQRANGATAAEISEKLGVSLGTAKNLVWYLRRDGKKIVVDREKDRKPYVIK